MFSGLELFTDEEPKNNETVDYNDMFFSMEGGRDQPKTEKKPEKKPTKNIKHTLYYPYIYDYG